MNTSQIEQPLTDNDVAAVTAALSSPNASGAARIGMLKMIVTAAASSEQLKLTSHDIFTALAAGSSNAMDTALYEALALETLVGGSVGALTIQAAGIMKLTEWGKDAAKWLASKVLSIEGMIGGVVGESIKNGTESLLNWLGISPSSSHDSSQSLQMITLMAGSSAPALAAAVSLLSSKATSSGAMGTTSSSGSKSASASASASQSASASTTSSSSGSSDTRRRNDGMSIGIRTRRSLVQKRS